MEAFNKQLATELFKPVDVQKLQDPEKVSAIWVKNLGSSVNKMSNATLSMIGMKPKDAIKIDIVRLDKTYSGQKLLLEDGLYIYLYWPREQGGDQKKTGYKLYLK